MSNLTQGDRVFHPNQKGWGLGKVLNVTPDNIDVFFVGTGAKRLSRSFVQLETAEGAAAKHRLLDNLIETSQIGSTDYVTTDMAIARFLAIHPDGFSAPRFLKDERDASVRAHQLCIQLLGETEISGLIAERRYQDVCDRARHIESVTNLLTKSEKTAFYSALETPLSQKTFSEALANLLYGADSDEDRFKGFVRALDLLGISRWPYATLFGFIRFPQEKVFIKPTVIQNVTKAFCWRINYKVEPNWRTYTAVLRLYNYLRTSLVEEGLMPKDMIDVQSFIWSTGQK
ncbi:DUF3553 domain-containing protein [Azonexus sp. IMCC34842]|uniref:DUF3553 domain-containing protein n=1 Tax=Azonexus sp. IMCC34842 TaxID=3420950 RepID=UPI003D13EABD